ncbi:hypothetical protein M885DRAFT_562383 [Pelagophyceae sp. CCMP2097]|nr:hypothetical protein M885DRAFT_562383 [Pelagophyceae sp. CCMP2097]|mmetsp:Transcript_20349/g.70236  ORF Transcript_20349/g.70236 Transcript_20349/m.70236 type:complete len:534 (-) Transcript_20349:29-1630(-)
MATVAASSTFVADGEVARLLQVEGERLEARLKGREEAEARLLAELQALCDESIAREVEVDELRSTNLAKQMAADAVAAANAADAAIAEAALRADADAPDVGARAKQDALAKRMASLYKGGADTPQTSTADGDDDDADKARLRRLLGGDDDDDDDQTASACADIVHDGDAQGTATRADDAASDDAGAGLDERASLHAQLRHFKRLCADVDASAAATATASFGDDDDAAFMDILDSRPWSPSISARMRRCDEAFEWSGWNVWKQWSPSREALPPELLALDPTRARADERSTSALLTSALFGGAAAEKFRKRAAADAAALVAAGPLFTDAAATFIVDVDSPPQTGAVVVEPWAPAGAWEFGDAVAAITDGVCEDDAGVRRDGTAGKAFGWPRLPLRRRRWARVVVHTQLPRAGPLAATVLRLAGGAAATEAEATRLADALQAALLLREGADDAAKVARLLDKDLLELEARLNTVADETRRAELLLAASKCAVPLALPGATIIAGTAQPMMTLPFVAPAMTLSFAARREALPNSVSF